jgi:hypothetical protein
MYVTETSITQSYTGHRSRHRNTRACDEKNGVQLSEENHVARFESHTEMTLKIYVILGITLYSLLNVCIA